MSGLRNYGVVTAAYWGFTLTDGALRMLVLLHFHALGYTPFELALLFVLYEFMGVVTNLTGGWVAARFGVKLTLTGGLALQISALLALSMLDTQWSKLASVMYVLAVQGVSGVAKDLSKMSAKSAIKLVVPDDAHAQLFKWVALLTGSKNALKGVGFFLGGFLLAVLGFAPALWAMAGCLGLVWLATAALLPGDMGRAKSKTKFTQVFSKSRAINRLSAARVFLFGARDVWFVVGLPVFLYDVLNWRFAEIGAFLALWVIGYGFVQGVAPMMTKRSADGRSSEVRAAQVWVLALAMVTLALAGAVQSGVSPTMTLIVGLGVFGFFFAVNSAVHSYLILALSDSDGVSLNVGFYYMANAAGRLGGTLLSGLAYQWGGLPGCLITAAVLLGFAGIFTLALGPVVHERAAPAE
ncbi:MAG: organoarsenical effux MFS transporter ArsJ [Rhodospirillaceae bacterium]|jgi:predicted MFS family arabinose efflux permease|nr:organoarsenical effux MFS transporter ArsJ [Rhodospirillaceae bacterium]MBT5811974.1 organoarsenical effux MFS transporter ArsJ [Rhodospirillaceae bacterium]